MLNSYASIVAEVIGQLKKDLKQARERVIYAKSQRQAHHLVLTRCKEEGNALKEKNDQHVQENERLRAQLAVGEAKD